MHPSLKGKRARNQKVWPSDRNRHQTPTERGWDNASRKVAGGNLPCSLYNHHKFILLSTTPRADPGGRQFFKRSVQRDTLRIVAGLREIDIPAFRASVLVHDPDIPGRAYMYLEEREEEQKEAGDFGKETSRPRYHSL